VITQISRTNNAQANSLVWLGSGTDEVIEASKQKVRVLTQPSIVSPELVMEIDDIYDSPNWVEDVIEYLRKGELPEDKKEARKVRM
jgi:hypothetical protein